MRISARFRLVLLLALFLPLTGCLFRSHKVKQEKLSTAVLKTATVQDLVQRINSEARKVQTLNATVNIATSVGGARKGKVTEYQEIRGYILVRQPGMLRMIGLLPVIRNRAFDMVSNGAEFKLSVPPKNKFYEGRNDFIPPGASGLSVLRPQIIYDALLLNDIDPREDVAVLESGMETVQDPKTNKEVTQPDYRVIVIHRFAQNWTLARRIYFNRVDLQPRRQEIYNGQGEVASDIHYDNWKQYSDIWFPSVIQIWRPTEEYEITISVVKIALNEPLTDQQFALAQPPGAEVVHVGNGQQTATDGSKPPGK